MLRCLIQCFGMWEYTTVHGIAKKSRINLYLNDQEYVPKCITETNNTFYYFSDCIELRDPHCAWDSFKAACVSVDLVTSYHFLVQDVRFGNVSKCKTSSGMVK